MIGVVGVDEFGCVSRQVVGQWWLSDEWVYDEEDGGIPGQLQGEFNSGHLAKLGAVRPISPPFFFFSEIQKYPYSSELKEKKKQQKKKAFE